MEEVPELPLRDENLGGEVKATSAEDDGGDVVTELEEDGGSTAKVSKLNLISSLFVCVFVCWLVCLFVGLCPVLICIFTTAAIDWTM